MDRVGFECAGSVGLGCIGGTVVSDPAGSALDLTERLRSIAPEYIDLVTAATDAQFENAFVAILEKKLAALERSKREYQEVGEVGLTAFLVAALSVPGLTASSVVTPKPANGGQGKTGQREEAGDTVVLPCNFLCRQVHFRTPAPRTTFEYMTMMEKAIEHGGDSGAISQ